MTRAEIIADLRKTSDAGKDVDTVCEALALLLEQHQPREVSVYEKRQRALELAACNDDAAAVVARAEKYFTFLDGKSVAP